MEKNCATSLMLPAISPLVAHLKHTHTHISLGKIFYFFRSQLIKWEDSSMTNGVLSISMKTWITRVCSLWCQHTKRTEEQMGTLLPCFVHMQRLIYTIGSIPIYDFKFLCLKIGLWCIHRQFICSNRRKADRILNVEVGGRLWKICFDCFHYLWELRSSLGSQKVGLELLEV